MTDMLDEAIGAVKFANGQTGNVHFVATIMKAVARGELIRAAPAAIAASPEGSMLLAEALLAQRAQIEADHAALIREAKAQGMERALGIMKTAGDSAVTEALGQRLCCNGQDCGCHGATVEEYLEHLIRAEAAAIRGETP